jgi:hypothetical protein
MTENIHKETKFESNLNFGTVSAVCREPILTQTINVDNNGIFNYNADVYAIIHKY